MIWPNLSAVKHVSGRAATEQDVNEGAAVFQLQQEGVNIGEPIEMMIPQYAIHLDSHSGAETPVIIIQAEKANGQKVIGALNFASDEYMMGFLDEYELLGSQL